jgi:hypothetical protein
MSNISPLKSIEHGPLPITILSALEEYFQDAFCFQKITECPKMISWEPQPAEILKHYWNNLQGSVIAFRQTQPYHPCLDYVSFLNHPCRFQDIQTALHRKSTHIFWKIGPYLGDFQMRRLLHYDTLHVIELTEKEAAMLEYLCQSPNHSIDRENLLKDVWKYNAELTTHTLETHIYRLRQKLTPHENLLLTTETGYMLVL